jgi:uncharacterized membrane protein YhaH (DUF805 family)
MFKILYSLNLNIIVHGSQIIDKTPPRIFLIEINGTLCTRNSNILMIREPATLLPIYSICCIGRRLRSASKTGNIIVLVFILFVI